MTTATRPMTLEQFIELPDPEDGHLELIAGEVVHMAGGDSDHSMIIGNLQVELGAFIRRHSLGQLLGDGNFHLRDNPTWAPVPDVAFATHGTLQRIYRRGAFFEGAPDLAVEVVSKSNSSNEIARKVLAYIEAGAQRVWVVSPSLRTVMVHRGDWTSRTVRMGEALTSDDAGFAVEGFELALRDIFPPEPDASASAVH